MKMRASQLLMKAGLLCAVGALWGCVSTNEAIQQANLSEAESQQFRKAQTKTRAQGTALGALIGAGIGYATGGTEGAIAGGIAGGTLGLGVGEKKAQTQGQILVSEARLNQMIASSVNAG